jgi:formylglycine-generating enzyme required for sulfatase activity
MYMAGILWRFDPRADWRHPGFSQTNRDPVVCVSWEDARAYVRWLNTKTAGQAEGPYRLPSGAEWLYAARGGIRNAVAYYWGHLPSHEYANYGLDFCAPCGQAKQGRDQWDYTSPVGSFEPNSFGLFDMTGNVWQWTDDCSHAEPTVSADGSAVKEGDCQVRLLFGGSYDDDPFTEQIDKIGANSNPYAIGIRNYANGFRVARTLP